MRLFVFYLFHGLVRVCKINSNIIGVQWGPKNPNLRAHFSSGKRGLPSFLLNGGPEGGIFLEPLNANDRLFFSYINSTFSDRKVRYCILSVGDVTEVDVYRQ